MANPNPTPVSVDPINILRDLLGGGGTGGSAYGAVTTQFGAPAAFTGAPHDGIDFAVAPGTQVHVPVGGTVTRAWFDSIGGNQVAVQTAAGFTQIFAHLSGYTVKAGQAVATGDPIGTTGSSGMSTGPHIDYVVMKPGATTTAWGNTVDPGLFISEFAGVVPTQQLINDVRNFVLFGIPGPALDALAKGDNGPLKAAFSAQFPGVPLSTLQQAVYQSSGQLPDASQVPLFGAAGQALVDTAQGTSTASNPLEAIAASLSTLTSDLTNPQKIAAASLTVAAVGLILVGVFIYIRGGGGEQVQQVARV